MQINKEKQATLYKIMISLVSHQQHSITGGIIIMGWARTPDYETEILYKRRRLSYSYLIYFHFSFHLHKWNSLYQSSSKNNAFVVHFYA